MKKLILFLLLIAPLASPLLAGWQAEAESFSETARGIGYKNANEMIAFLDQAESGGSADKGGLARFAADPAAFLEESGIGWTVFLILLGGLLLNLTPCVLPMIPVNIAIIGAGAQSESRSKGFALGATYGLGIAAVYGALGLIAVLGGAGFGTLNASPWFNIGIALVFLLLALSMFGVVHIDFSKFQAGKGAQFKSKFATSFVMGGIAALLAGACVAPVVLAVLLLAGNLYAQGAGIGLLLPFLLGVGMALPWPLAGAGFTFLPKPGGWMEWVKRGFGVLILLLAFYYGKLGFSLLNAGSTDSESQDLESELAAASAAQEPVLLYFGAEWCKNCKEMEKDTWPDPEVEKRLAGYRFIKVDATEIDQSPISEIIEKFRIQGLPTYIVLHPRAD
jgi:thioredoxin:protein disulfide reductase